MKKSHIVFIVSGLVLVSVAVWLGVSGFSVAGGESIQLVVIIALILFGGAVGIKRLKSERAGEPAEDEMSKKIVSKAAAASYFISLYLWLVIMYLADKKVCAVEELFGWGILGMGVLFAAAVVFYRIIGVKE